MFDVNLGKPAADGSHIETKHYSSVLLEGNSGIIYCETIPLMRGPERNLNNSIVKIRTTYTKDLIEARIAQSYFLISLEEGIKEGKTAKQALIDASKPTCEEQAEATRRCNFFFRR